MVSPFGETCTGTEGLDSAALHLVGATSRASLEHSVLLSFSPICYVQIAGVPDALRSRCVVLAHSVRDCRRRALWAGTNLGSHLATFWDRRAIPATGAAVQDALASSTLVERESEGRAVRGADHLACWRDLGLRELSGPRSPGANRRTSVAIYAFGPCRASTSTPPFSSS